MNHPNIQSIAAAMDHIGFAVFRYNFLYMERGGGRESSKVSVGTVKAATHFAQSLMKELPLFVGGHSYGGRMSSHAAVEGFDQEIKGMIYFAFPLHAPGREGDARGLHLRDIKFPQLFLSGSRDTFSTGELLENLVASIDASAKLVRLDTANHSYKILKRSRTRTDDVFEEMSEAVGQWLLEI